MAPGRINQTRVQSPKAGQKSGWLSTIRGRLYLAFGFAASLTIIGSSIAFYEFTVIGLTTNEIASRSLPTTTVSLRLAEQASSLVSSGPRLMAAGTDAIRAEIMENIGKQEKNIEDGIAHLKKLGIARADDIEASRRALADRLQTLNEAVSNRIIMSSERAYLASSVRAAHEALLIGLAPAIDDANFDLMMGARQEGAAALDARLEYLRRLLETESESNLLAGLLTEASLVNDASRLEPLRDLIDAAQRKITKNLNSINDRAQQQKLAALYKQLGMIGADDGIIAARAYELSQQQRAQLAFNAAQAEATKLKHAVDDLVAEQGRIAQEISGYAGGQIRSGQLILTVLSIAAVIGAVLVAWLYVGRSVARRLGFLSEAMRRIADGDLNVDLRDIEAMKLPTWDARFCFSGRQRLTRRAPGVKRANKLGRWNPGGSSSKVRLMHSSARCPTLPKRSIGPPPPWTAPRARWRTAPPAIRSRRLRLRRRRHRQPRMSGLWRQLRKKLRNQSSTLQPGLRIQQWSQARQRARPRLLPTLSKACRRQSTRSARSATSSAALRRRQTSLR
jgi:hypothetical protein